MLVTGRGSGQITAEECVVIAAQLKKMTLKHIRIAGVKYRIFFHAPHERLVGQVRAVFPPSQWPASLCL